MKKRNLAANFFHCLGVWRSFRRYPGLFTLADASSTWKGVLLPMRFVDREGGRGLARCATIKTMGDEVHRIALPQQGIQFYRLGPVDNNLYWNIAQEVDPKFPHCYTTPPIHLSSRSLVIDVGACEGLFAFRVVKQFNVARVICFEPSERVARYTRLGAEENGLGQRVLVETMAVGRESGTVGFEEAAIPDGNRITNDPDAIGVSKIKCVSLDDYCLENNIKLGCEDLIKIDAEGSDFEILKGAEKVIREGSPQIAVTTYHCPEHARQIVEWLKQIQPAYRMRLKGFSFWTAKPTPVLLQAAF